MDINQIELSGIIYIFTFIVSLVGLLIVFGIVKRTKDKMRYGLFMQGLPKLSTDLILKLEVFKEETWWKD